MVLEPPHICNIKIDFCVGKHHLEIDKMYCYTLLMISPPDPLSAMEGWWSPPNS